MTLANVNEIYNQRQDKMAELKKLAPSKVLELAKTFDLSFSDELPIEGVIRAIAKFLFPYKNEELEVASGTFEVRCVVGLKGRKFKIKVNVVYPE